MVPKEWDLKALGEIAQITSGGTPSRDKSEYWLNGTVPWIRTTEVQNCILNFEDTVEFITELGLQKSSAKLMPHGTILLAMIGQGKTRGQVALLNFSASTNQNCAAIILKNGHHAGFYFYFLLSQYENIRALSNSAGQSNLTGALVKSIQIPVPPLLEQKKIAQILSTWDQAIATTEHLLDLAGQQKKALMQQLLTGKKRSPGFEGAWRNLPLCKMAEIIVSPVDKKTEPNEFAVELCNYTDVYYNHQITRKINFMRATATKAEIEKYTLKKGDVIITKDSETPGDIAVPALVAEDLNGVVCGYHLAIIRPDNNCVDGAFLNYLFSMQKTRYYFFTLATGATRFGLSVGAINHSHFNIPSIDEQKKIASVLSVSDQEIDTLQSQLDGLKQEKKALMQALLTGKRRVQL